MKLYNGPGPNPHVVRMFIAERGITGIASQDVDLMSGANRQPEHLARNPAGQLPTLELDDGTFIAEITAICEYLDEVADGPSLIGDSPEQRAETRMWMRRIDLNILEPLANGFRYAEGLALFKDRMICLPEASDGLKRIAADKIAWLNTQMEGRQWICGDRFTLADILLYCFLVFGGQVGQPLDKANSNIAAWLERVGGRASAAA